MPDDPAPNDAPTPPQGVPTPPYYPPSPWQQQPENLPPFSESPLPAGPPAPRQQERRDPGYSQQPSYLDTPAPPVPVVSRADVDKPPADFDG